jgi:HemY protein
MKLLIIIAIALVIGGGLIWLAEFEPGYVLFQYQGWSLETSVIVFLLAFVLLVVAGYIGLRSLVLLKQTPGKLSSWQSAKRLSRANKTLTRGLITLEEGRWAEAERLLMRYAGHSETPLLHYLAAARAAQKQNAAERRDNYLRLAHDTTDGADIAVGVVQAELQLAADQKEQALATLQHLREVSPKHPYVLQLLQKLYSDMNEWQGVQDVLPDLRKGHVLASSDVKSLSTEATVGQLEAAIAKQDWERVSDIWLKAPTKIRHSEAMLNAYVVGLNQQGRGKEAGPLIEAYMNNDWSDQLVYQYGLIRLDDLTAQLARAEKWMKQHPDNPWLLLTVGRLLKANKLWVKAEDTLRDSIVHGPRGETYQELAEVLALEGDNDLQVTEAYQKGLALMLSQSDATS